MIQIVKYRCGPWPEKGCGGTWVEQEDDKSLAAPLECPLCGATFCGEECCGNMWEVVPLTPIDAVSLVDTQ